MLSMAGEARDWSKPWPDAASKASWPAPTSWTTLRWVSTYLSTAHPMQPPCTRIYSDFYRPQVEFSSKAICVNGTWPLLHSAQAANALSPLGSSHTHKFSTVTYFMPDSYPGAQHGGACPLQTTTLPPMTHVLVVLPRDRLYRSRVCVTPVCCMATSRASHSSRAQCISS